MFEKKSVRQGRWLWCAWSSEPGQGEDDLDPFGPGATAGPPAPAAGSGLDSAQGSLTGIPQLLHVITLSV